MKSHYLVRSRAGQDLDDYADYLARNATIEVTLRFLDAAEDTFALMATQPNMGWHSRLKYAALESLRVFRVSGFEHMLIFVQASGGWSRDPSRHSRLPKFAEPVSSQA